MFYVHTICLVPHTEQANENPSLAQLVTDTENNLRGHSFPEGWPSHTGFYWKAAKQTPGH